MQAKFSTASTTIRNKEQEEESVARAASCTAIHPVPLFTTISWGYRTITHPLIPAAT